MVNWSLNLINKYGKSSVTIFATICIVLISTLIGYLDILIFDHNLVPTLYLSFFIPAFLAPPTILFLLTLIIKLGQIEKEIDTVLKSAGDAFFIHDRNGNFIEVNDAACRSLGYTRDELLALGVTDVLVKQGSKMLSDLWDELQHGDAVTVHGEHRRKDGSTFPVESRVSNFEFGEDLNVLALVRDVSQRERVLESLRESEEKFRKSFEHASIGMTITELDGNFRAVNPAWCKMIGYSEQELLGKSIEDITHPDDILSTVEARQNMIGGDSSITQVEKRYVHKDGHTVWGLMSRAIVSDAEGAALYFIGQIQDITDRKIADQQSRRHYEQLAHVSRVATMGEMATGIAHELNQPLAAIAAYIDGSLRRLNAGEQPSQQIIEALEKASDQAIRAGEVIKRLRDFVRREDAKTDNLEVNKTIETAIQFLKADFDLNKVTLSLELFPQTSIIKGDPILIQQVIFNLVRNSVDAMSSMSPGSGELTIKSHKEADKVLIEIRDNGPGIDPNFQDQLFEPYISTKKSGLGLGLPICRSIVNEHEGEIWYEPLTTGGVAFFIQLPLVESGL